MREFKVSMYNLLMNQCLGDPENVVLKKGNQLGGEYKPLCPADLTVAVGFNVLCFNWK